MSLDCTGSEWGAAEPVRIESFALGRANAKSWFDRLLAGMIEAGLGIPALCLYLSLTGPELEVRILALDLPMPRSEPLRRAGGRRAWSPAEVRQLIQWWGEGIRVGRIAEALGRSKGSVYYKKRKLGLPPRDRKSLVDRDPLAEADVCLGAGVEVLRRHPPGESTPGWAGKPGEASSPSEAIEKAPVARGAGVAWHPAGLPRELDESAVESICRTASRRRAGREALVDRERAPEGVDAPKGRDLGSVLLGTASAELLVAIEAARKFAKKAYRKMPADWSRSDWSETEVLELALRGFAGQSRFGIARDMGISACAAADRLTRIGMGSVWGDFRAKGLKNGADGFDVAVGLERMQNLRAVGRVCGMLETLFFVGDRDRTQIHNCPEWHRNFSPEARERKARREREKEAKPEKVKAADRQVVVTLARATNASAPGHDAYLDRVLAEAVENCETEPAVPRAAPCAVAEVGGLVETAGETPIEGLGEWEQRELWPIELASACTEIGCDFEDTSDAAPITMNGEDDGDRSDASEEARLEVVEIE